MSKTGGGGLARVPNLRVCKHPDWRVAHVRGKDELTSCRGTVQSAWQKPPMRRKGGRAGLPARVSGRHVVRGTDSPHLSRKCAQVTGKAGENGQNSGVMGGSSPWTRPSARGCGDTLKAPAGDQRPILGGDRPSKTALGSLSLGSPAGRTPPHGDGSMYSQANVKAGKV